MTTTPTVWKAEHQLNPAETVDLNQQALAIVDIGLGRYITVYHQLGDYRGQIFDAEGNRLGGTFQVNVASGNDSSGASPPSLAARPGGGFVAAYIAGGGLNGVFFDVYDADGDRISGGTIQSIDLPDLTGPSLAMRTDGSFLVTFVRKNDGDGTFDVVGRRVAANGTVDSSEITIFDSGDTDQTFAEAATLSNGNYVVAYQNFFGAGDHDIEFKIFGQTGDPPAGFFQVTPLSNDDDTDPQVAALTGGGFVVVWRDSNDGGGSGIMASVFNNSGGNVAGGTTGFLVNTNTAGNQTSPDVTALKDGGFIVIWDDDGTGTVRGQRFNAAGAKVGSEFTAGDVFGESFPSTTVLGDGRIIIGFQAAKGTLPTIKFDLDGTIFDPREKTINGTSGADVLTSRIDGATVNGLGGIDTLLGQGSADTLDGGSSADTMKGRGGGDTYVVDNAGDVVDETGGSGTDLVKSSRSFSLSDTAHAKGTIENLTLTGTAAKGTGNGSVNTIKGNASANELFGLGSNDSLDGAGGNDRVNGGVGIDSLTGGIGLDTFVFDAAVSSATIAAANADIIADFDPKDDTIELLASVFPKLKVGVLKNKTFDSGKKKPSKDKHAVYYDEKNGGLWYDANGKKQKGKGDVLIATLDPGLDLTAADIVVA